jgi:GGDEF domain-containing protein
VLTLYSTGKNAFNEEHERIIEEVARQIAPIVKRAVESGRHRTTAVRKFATTLPTVEQMRQVITLSGAAYLPKPVSILLIEMSSLSGTNRRADQNIDANPLFELAAMTRRHLRSGDLLFQHGSDALVAVLLQTDYAIAEAVGGRIQDAAKIERASGLRSAIVVTALSLSEKDASIDDLINKATEAIRRRRSNGLSDGLPESIH